MHNIINNILASTKKRVDLLLPVEKRAPLAHRRDFIKEVRFRQESGDLPVIPEVKPASPAGKNRDIGPAEAAALAKQMESAGAAGVSVLTEPEFFNGSMDNLHSVYNSVKIPVLRKDFIIDEKQVYETDSDMILLIARILGYRLDEFVELSLSLGLEPLVEIHSEPEIDGALDTRAKIIGINNRDLDTMNIDLATAEHIAPIIRETADEERDLVIVAESGIRMPGDAIRMIDAGCDAILVGTSIMEGDVYTNTYQLVKSLNKQRGKR